MNNYIVIQGVNKGKRIDIVLKDKNFHKGNLRIIIKDDIIEIHRSKDIRVKQNWIKEKVQQVHYINT
ncbi:MAG: hypothetical protein H7Y18_01085 [Clostridiaceae bacterium]|nr:hypothetical protein [Clostridiaceae bacterium]